MRKLLLLLSLSCTISGLTAQTTTYSANEDFESYNNEDYLGVKNPSRWKVLFDDPGTNTDVKVSNVKPRTGKNSIYLFSNIVGGGPQNIYMPLFENGTTENHGTVDFSVWLYIPTQQGAYFNFQAASPIPEAMACQVFFDNNNDLRITDEYNRTTGYVRYPQNTWFKFSAKVNLTLNEWTFLLNDKSFAVSTFPNNTLYAFNINPQSVENQSSFYVDDISINFKKEELNDLDAAISPLQVKSDLLQGQSSTVSAQIRNLGKQTVQKIELEWSDGQSKHTQILDNLNLISLKDKSFSLDQDYIAKTGADKVSIRIVKVNDQVDAVATNNYREQSVNVYVPTPGKKVFTEQATGTWCIWCPRGHVFMEKMSRDYPDYFVGISVHGDQNDPMRMNSYVGSLSIPGFPHTVMNRDTKQDPSDLESAFFEHIVKPVSARIQTTVKQGSSARSLIISPKASFLDGAPNGNYKLVVILAEDSIKGTTAAYSQANIYSGGRAGVMGGYEKLPNPVPANKMIYRNVARALLNGFTGQSKSFSNIKDGTLFELPDIVYEVPNTFFMNKLEVITALIGPDGTVDNVEVSKASQFLVSAQEVHPPSILKSIVPNPADQECFVELNATETSSVDISIVDATGKIVKTQNYGNLEGNHRLSLDTSELENGFYLLQIKVGKSIQSDKIVVLH